MKPFAFLLSFLFLFSCSQETKESPPADLIPQEKMVSVLVDVHLLEASIGIRQGPDPNRATLTYYDVFKKHGLTHAQYERSLAWYSSRLDEFEKMYEEVLNELSRRQARELAGQQPAKNDSAKKDSATIKPTGIFRKPSK